MGTANINEISGDNDSSGDCEQDYSISSHSLSDEDTGPGLWSESHHFRLGQEIRRSHF